MDVGYKKVNGLWLGSQKVVSLDKGNSRIFENQDDPNTVTLFGRKYKTVQIGNRKWTAENIVITEGLTAEDHYMYKDLDYLNTYGLLYYWKSVAILNNILPDGWRVPNESDADYLIGYPASGSYEQGKLIAGKYYKANSDLWQSGKGLDSYGFKALPGGCCWWDGSYDAIGTEANFLVNYGDYIHYMYMKSDSDTFYEVYSRKNVGAYMNIRLCKDL